MGLTYGVYAMLWWVLPCLVVKVSGFLREVVGVKPEDPQSKAVLVRGLVWHSALRKRVFSIRLIPPFLSV